MKNKLFLTAIVVIVISYLISFAVSYVSLNSVIADNSQQVTNVIAERIYDAINNELTKPITVSRTIARDPLLIGRLKKEKDFNLEKNIEDFASFLRSIRNGFGYESTFLVSETSHVYYTHEGFNKIIDVVNDDHDIWYKDFVDHNMEYELHVDEDQTHEDEMTIFINTRILDEEGQLMGVCGMGVQLDNLLGLIKELEQLFEVNIDLVDGTGLVLVDTDRNNIEKLVLRDIPTNDIQHGEYVFQMEGQSFVGTRFVEDLSWFLVIKNNANFGASAYVKLLYVYLVILVLLIFSILGAIYVILKREKSLDKASSIDVLTGLNIRRAYEEDIKMLQKKKNKDVTFVSLDLNGLKRVNDNIGHLAGDELIVGAGHFIRDYFRKMGKCYRVGGDEFAVIIENCNVDEKKVYSEFKELIARWHGNLVDKMSISIGIARSCDYDYEDIKKLIELADMQMYKDKDLYYSSQKKL